MLVPDGYVQVDVGDVFYNERIKKIVILGIPAENHNCDEEGCGSLDHVILRGNVDSFTGERKGCGGCCAKLL